jgi:hypothetical protein
MIMTITQEGRVGPDPVILEAMAYVAKRYSAVCAVTAEPDRTGVLRICVVVEDDIRGDRARLRLSRRIVDVWVSSRSNVLAQLRSEPSVVRRLFAGATFAFGDRTFAEELLAKARADFSRKELADEIRFQIAVRPYDLFREFESLAKDDLVGAALAANAVIGACIEGYLQMNGHCPLSLTDALKFIRLSNARAASSLDTAMGMSVIELVKRPEALASVLNSLIGMEPTHREIWASARPRGKRDGSVGAVHTYTLEQHPAAAAIRAYEAGKRRVASPTA